MPKGLGDFFLPICRLNALLLEQSAKKIVEKKYAYIDIHAHIVNRYIYICVYRSVHIYIDIHTCMDLTFNLKEYGKNILHPCLLPFILY